MRTESVSTGFGDLPTQLYIGGKWRAGRSNERFPVLDPASGDEFASVASATVEDALDAVASAHGALPAWSATAPRERSETLRRAFEIMKAREKPLAELIVRENGKALSDAISEVRYAAEFFRWYAEEAVR